MKGKEKRLSLILIVFLFLAAWGTAGSEADIYQFPEVPEAAETATADLSEKRIQVEEDFDSQELNSITGKTNYRNKVLLVDESFTSKLPLVIIDTGEQKPKRGVVWDGEKDYYVSTGEDPYAYGKISVINNTDDVNRPTDHTQTHSFCKLKIRGNSSGNYDKKQYLVKLTDESGKFEKHNVLNMGSDSEWILNVSFIDKSLLRNYLAYSTAGEIMPYTPDVQFCEVLWKKRKWLSV